jgi:hypothetical protein
MLSIRCMLCAVCCCTLAPSPCSSGARATRNATEVHGWFQISTTHSPWRLHCRLAPLASLLRAWRAIAQTLPTKLFGEKAQPQASGSRHVHVFRGLQEATCCL